MWLGRWALVNSMVPISSAINWVIMAKHLRQKYFQIDKRSTESRDTVERAIVITILQWIEALTRRWTVVLWSRLFRWISALISPKYQWIVASLKRWVAAWLKQWLDQFLGETTQLQSSFKRVSSHNDQTTIQAEVKLVDWTTPSWTSQSMNKN